MRWSELRKHTVENLAPSVRNRVDFHSTRYSSGAGCSCGRGWITVDGSELVQLNTAERWHPGARHFVPGYASLEEFPCRTPGHLVERGEFTRFDLHVACWDVLHDGAAAGLRSAAPLTRAVAALHRKCGVRSLLRLLDEERHPLVIELASLRLHAEGRLCPFPAELR